MWFTRVSINNPVFATMIMVALCVLGLFSYNQLGVERMPDITPPIVFVSVAYPGASAEAGTRGIRVVVLLANPNEVFRAGQYASAVVLLDDSAQRLTLPVAALGQASGQDFVWALEKGALVRRIVITGRRDDTLGRVEVTRGLSADAQVLAARFDALKEGAQARINGTPGVPAARASAPPPKAS